MIAGAMFIQPMAFSEYFTGAILVLPQHDVIGQIAEHYHDKSSLEVVFGFMLHGMMQPPFWLAIFGIFLAWLFYIRKPELPGKVTAAVAPLYNLLMNKYYIDDFNQKFFANGTVGIGRLLSKYGDTVFIDGFAMIIGLLVLMTWFLSVN
jgi:NADH-quinone oxidoreductase subunit L